MTLRRSVRQLVSSQCQAFGRASSHWMHRAIAASVAAAVLAGCSTGQLYQDTMEAIDYSLFSWRSFDDTNPVQQQSETDSVQARISFEQCIEELSASLARLNQQRPQLRPTREERVLEVVECMHKKGWTPIESIIVITS